MTSINELLSAVEGSSKVVTLAANEYFDFNAKDQAVVIEQGELMVVGQKDPKTGRAGRQLFKEADPVGVAESIASRVSDFDFSVNTDMRLRVFDGALMRSHVNKAGVFARTIARYSLKRIFEDAKKDAKASIVFEDEFIYKNYEDLRSVEFAAETQIFKAGAESDKMYFIEKGQVTINSEQNKHIATLGVGECFGEGALMGAATRNASAVTETDAELVIIESEMAEQELKNEHPMTWLATLLLLKQVGLMNQFRGKR